MAKYIIANHYPSNKPEKIMQQQQSNNIKPQKVGGKKMPASVKTGLYKGVPVKNVPYWSQPGSIKKGPGYVDPNKSAKKTIPVKNSDKSKKKYRPKTYNQVAKSVRKTMGY